MTSRIWLLSAVVFLLSPVALFAQIKPGVVDLSANYGRSNYPGANSNPELGYPSFGFATTYNVSHHVGVGAEYTYNILGTLNVQGNANATIHENMQQFGALVRTTLWNRRISPYFSAAGGVANDHTAQISGNAVTRQSISGGYVAGGIGANIFVSRGFGIRPEIRIEENVFPSTSVTGVVVSGGSTTNVHGMIAVFYQF
jgi:hypothetical protein